MNPFAPVRRVVTTTTEDGRSTLWLDGPSPAEFTTPERPGYRSTNLWRTHGEVAAEAAPDDIAEHRGVRPPHRGTVLRVIDFPPQPADPQERRRQSEAVFRSLFSDAGHQPDSPRHHGMHRTPTVDYAIVLHGEIAAILEDGETVLRAGDVLVQRGTNHAWENRSTGHCRVAFILIDAPGPAA